jgi:hypothetical protein
MTNTVAVGAVAPGENADPESTSCFTATDMAKAAAQGFRDGQLASLIVMPVYRSERGSDGELTYEAKAWNAALDEVARLNADHVEHVRAMVVPEGWWQIIHDTLRNYRMSTLDDGHGDGYPLIDAMTADGQSVAGGIEECTYLADAIRNGLLAAAPTPEPASPISAQGEGGDK